MLDRYRARRQRELRDTAWGEAAAVQKPSAEAALISREQLALVEQAIAATGERPARIFRRFRVDGILQRDIAAEMGISLRSEEHTSELQSLMRISYAVFCLKKKKQQQIRKSRRI